jgi:hypothetical protein
MNPNQMDALIGIASGCGILIICILLIMGVL